MVGGLYWRAPTAAELAGTGLKLKHYPEPQVEAWPEVWTVIDLYSRRLCTQWRGAGMELIGLDYTVAFAEIDRMKLSDEDREDFVDLLRIVEGLAAAKCVGR